MVGTQLRVTMPFLLAGCVARGEFNLCQVPQTTGRAVIKDSPFSELPISTLLTMELELTIAVLLTRAGSSLMMSVCLIFLPCVTARRWLFHSLQDYYSSVWVSMIVE